MATLGLAETIAAAMITKLQAGLETRLVAINTEKGDGIEVHAPGTNDYYMGGVTSLTPPRCAIVVTDLPGRYDQEGQGIVLEARMFAFVVDVDSDRSTLARKLWRLRRGLVETLCLDAPAYALTGVAARIFPAEDVPGPVFEPRNEVTVWSGYSGVIFSVRRYEN